MEIIKWISTLLIPFMIIATIISGLFKKVDIYGAFSEGVKESIHTVYNIFPSIITIMMAITLFKDSGLSDFLTGLLSPLLSRLNIPSEVIPLALLKPMSGSGSLGMLNRILLSSGPDSRAGFIASVIAGSTETTFYTVAVYFGSIGIKDVGYTVKCALIADFICLAVGVAVSNLIFF